MGISKRFIDLARAELNALLDKAAHAGDGERGDDDAYGTLPTGWDGLTHLSDDELVAEIERRKRARAEAERGSRGPRSAGGGGARPAGGARASGAGRATGARVPADEVTRAYACLEVPPGSDFETVRKAYRNLMRKYHPDHHTGSPEKQKAANELAQKLTDAYKLLEKRLRR